jgi:hypothetical protein
MVGSRRRPVEDKVATTKGHAIASSVAFRDLPALGSMGADQRGGDRWTPQTLQAGYRWETEQAGGSMGEEPTLKELQQRIEQLEESVDELKAWYTGLEQHIISATATLRVVVELAKGG